MKLKRLILEVAMPEEVIPEVAVQGILKSIRKYVGKEKAYCDFCFDLIMPQKILWLQNDHELKGDMPPQMLMQMSGMGMPENMKEKLPIGFPEIPEIAAESTAEKKSKRSGNEKNVKKDLKRAEK